MHLGQVGLMCGSAPVPTRRWTLRPGGFSNTLSIPTRQHQVEADMRGGGQAGVSCSAEQDRSTAKDKQTCEIREVLFDQDLSALLPGWRECNAHAADHTIVCDPEWLRERYKQEKADVRAYLLERDGTVVGAVACEFSRHWLARRFGSLKVPNLPVAMARLLGYTPNLPTQAAAHDQLFRRLLSLKFDVIYMTGIKTDSFFW